MEMIEIFEGDRKVAELPESEFWGLSGPEKKSFIEAQEMTGRTIGKGEVRDGAIP